MQFIRLVLTQKWHWDKDLKPVWGQPCGFLGRSVLCRGNIEDKGVETDLE